MMILLVCSLFVASALAHGNYNYNSGSSQAVYSGYSTAGLVDVPYEVLYDSRRDGPNEPPGIRTPGLVDVPYEVVYDSRRDGPQRGMNSFQQRQQPMMRQQQPTMSRHQQMRQVQQPIRSFQQSNYGGSNNLIDVPYIVEYDSRRDGHNSPKKDLSKNANLIDVPYITVFDSRRDGPQRKF